MKFKKFKILAPVLLGLSAPTAFAFPVVTVRGGVAPPTIATTVAKGVVSPVTVITKAVKGVTTTPATVVGKVAKAINSPTTFVVDTITKSMTPAPFRSSSVQASTATYAPPSKKEPSAENNKQTRAEAMPDESNDRTMMIIGEPKPIFLSKDSCDEVSAKTIEFVTIPSTEASLKKYQASVTAVVGSMEIYPKASGTFVRQKLLNKDAFVVSFQGRWIRHRKTFHLDHDAIVYQGDKLTKVDFLKRGDPVEVAFLESGYKYVAVAVESNRTGEYVASR